MTKLFHNGDPRWRETACPVADRSHLRLLVVAITPTALLLRPKGTRQTVTLPYTAAYQLAARLEADRLVAERKERRRRHGVARGRL